MDIEIRHADVDDGESLLELWHGFTANLAEYDERYRHRETADERWLQYFENQLVDSKYGTVVVADAGEEIVGVLEARVMGDHPIFRLPDHGYINGHYVQADYRQAGIGSRLVEAAIEWFAADPRAVDFCRVDVLEGDASGAEAYRELGFEPVEHVYERSVE